MVIDKYFLVSSVSTVSTMIISYNSFTEETIPNVLVHLRSDNIERVWPKNLNLAQYIFVSRHRNCVRAYAKVSIWEVAKAIST